MVVPQPLRAFVWEPFNSLTYSISLSPDEPEFLCDTPTLEVARCTTSSDSASAITPWYYLHCVGNRHITSGSAVMGPDSLCPAYCAADNNTIFQHFFGIEFTIDATRHVRPFSPFEYASCLCFTDQLTYHLAHPDRHFCFVTTVPGNTSAWLFDQLHERLLQIRDDNTEIMDHTNISGPVCTIQALTNGAVSTTLPSLAQWIAAIANDPELAAIRDMVNNPDTITK